MLAHGFHPNPSQYARLETGASFSLGDYYRGWVNTYAKAGCNVLLPYYRGHNDSEGSTYPKQAGKVAFQERLYSSDLIVATHALERYLSTEYSKSCVYWASMGSPNKHNKNKVKLESLWSTAKYWLPKINVSPKYVIHHAKYDVFTPISSINF